ncbi:MAG: SPOR domain-containing protein [Burkholderiales bacterium]|nr:SPOR domain-containing protein [Burkholderiales bacterium]
MTDSLDAIQNRLRWINRGILLMAVLVLVGLLVFALRSFQSGRTVVVNQAGARAPGAIVATSKPATSASLAKPIAPNSAAAIPGAAHAASVSRPTPQAPTSASSFAHTLANTAPKSLKAADVNHAGSAAPAEPGAHSPIVHSANLEHNVKTVRLRLHPKETRRIKTNPIPTEARANVRHRLASKSAMCRRPGWYVQVGAFAEDWRFERLRIRMQHDGFATCKALQTPMDLSLLLVGAYPTRDSARRAQLRIKKLLGTDNYLRHLLAR